MRATIQVLDEHGFENATIPRIAKAAKVSPASVYRRFEDKDALIRETLLTALRSSAKVVERALDPKVFANKTLEEAAKSVLRSVMMQDREHPNLILAIKRFSEAPGEKAFAKESMELIGQNFRNMTTALAACHDISGIRERKKKIEFALLTVTSAIEVMILEPSSMWGELWKESDDKVLKRLLQMFLSYVRT